MMAAGLAMVAVGLVFTWAGVTGTPIADLLAGSKTVMSDGSGEHGGGFSGGYDKEAAKKGLEGPSGGGGGGFGAL